MLKKQLFGLHFTAVAILASACATLELPSASPAGVPDGAQPRAALPRAVEIEAIAGVVASDAEWVLAWQGTNNADGLVGLPGGSVIFAQEQPRQIGRLNAHDNYTVYLYETRGVGSLSAARNGHLYGVERTCTDPGRRSNEPCTEATAVSKIWPQRTILADAYNGMPLGRLNDLTIDSRGGAYFTVGGAFYADALGTVTRLSDNLQTNGIILSADETVLYVTNREVVVAFDVRQDGAVGNRRNFARLEAGGVGDGLAIDSMGRLYVTSNPGVQVFDRAGTYLGLIPTPRPSISVAFAGIDKRTLYIVGSGAALGPGGSEFITPEGVRNNAKTIYRIDMLAQGFLARPK